MNEMETFLRSMPTSTEDIAVLARTIIRQDKSRAHYLEKVKQIEEVASSLREFLAYQDNQMTVERVGNIVNRIERN